jgi:hypothetical protein
MNEPPLLTRQRSLLRDLGRAAAERARGEPGVTTGFRVNVERVEKEAAEAVAAAARKLAEEEKAAQAELRAARTAVLDKHETEVEAANKAAAVEREALASRYAAAKEAAQAANQEATWSVNAVHEGARTAAEDRLRQGKAQLATQMETLQGLQKNAQDLLARWGWPVEDLEAEARSAGAPPAKDPARGVADCITEVEGLLEKLRSLRAPRYLRRGPFTAIVALLWLIQIPLLGWLVVTLGGLGGGSQVRWLVSVVGLGVAASTLATLVIGFALYFVLRSVARTSVRECYLPLCRTLLEANTLREQLLTRMKEDYRTDLHNAKRQFNREMRRTTARFEKKREALKRKKDTAQPQVEERLLQRLAQSDQHRTDGLRGAEERSNARLAAARQRHADEVGQAEERRQRLLQEVRTSHARAWTALAGAWQEMMNQLRRTVAEVNQQTTAYYPPWDLAAWRDWAPPASPPPVVRFGSYQVRMESVPHGWSSEERLRAMTPPVIELPALAVFPDAPSVFIEAGEEGRSEAVAVLQMMLFRLLTALPPGKLRSIIIDPVGLGQNFAAFMHLADYDEQLVASRIWTETVHIEQRLADLTAHMENVIQKYLRNVYTDISEYNNYAGEVAEPFRILVVANFPVNFSTEAVRRLVSVAKSGPRCGVHTLISVDLRQPLPKGFDLNDLRGEGVHLVWKDGRFAWRDGDFGVYPLTVDPPPPDNLANTVLEKVGEAAKAAHRVEVPFEFIAPTPDTYWKADSRHGIRVALGRAGATQRQFFDLGKGTSQHALVAGKTGSGKSTMLHALIVNLSLMYSPDEVELYLIDFKKGVEFKCYAASGLPHAKVVAIESEREFGLSVLQRLDVELRARGERYRLAGVQNVADFREARPDEVIPRILLVVDEFQEFFTEDDRIAQEAAQLLDRLVRQGRAFGMHVLLGSQTLGGAYSLARSTIDQMAVRIALQCSEADAQLILSDDNSAARLLSRPGEAIYNDANGLVEGNHPFQVVWLDDVRREGFLRNIGELAHQRPPRHAMATVVFEGNAPADISKNHRLRQLLAGGIAADGSPPLAWLGDALAINDITAAPFRRQNGSNLLIVGQQEEPALGMLATAVIGLGARGAQEGEQRPQFTVVDGRQPEGASGLLARLPDIIPCPVRLAGWREVGSLVAEFAAEVERRQKTPEVEAAPLFLVLYGLQRMRDLRRVEDDFSFMPKSDGAAANPAQQLATLLREGPSLGVHTLMWCDTTNNLQRALDRQTLREISLRVVLQMGVADSSNLIDSPAASKLGLHRALFFSEEDGRLEKFRPYGLPPDEWLEEVRERLHAGSAAAAAR